MKRENSPNTDRDSANCKATVLIHEEIERIRRITLLLDLLRRRRALRFRC